MIQFSGIHHFIDYFSKNIKISEASSGVGAVEADITAATRHTPEDHQLPWPIFHRRPTFCKS